MNGDDDDDDDDDDNVHDSTDSGATLPNANKSDKSRNSPLCFKRKKSPYKTKGTTPSDNKIKKPSRSTKPSNKATLSKDTTSKRHQAKTSRNSPISLTNITEISLSKEEDKVKRKSFKDEDHGVTETTIQHRDIESHEPVKTEVEEVEKLSLEEYVLLQENFDYYNRNTEQRQEEQLEQPQPQQMSSDDQELVKSKDVAFDENLCKIHSSQDDDISKSPYLPVLTDQNENLENYPTSIGTEQFAIQKYPCECCECCRNHHLSITYCSPSLLPGDSDAVLEENILPGTLNLRIVKSVDNTEHVLAENKISLNTLFQPDVETQDDLGPANAVHNATGRNALTNEPPLNQTTATSSKTIQHCELPSVKLTITASTPSPQKCKFNERNNYCMCGCSLVNKNTNMQREQTIGNSSAECRTDEEFSRQYNTESKVQLSQSQPPPLPLPLPLPRESQGTPTPPPRSETPTPTPTPPPSPPLSISKQSELSKSVQTMTSSTTAFKTPALLTLPETDIQKSRESAPSVSSTKIIAAAAAQKHPPATPYERILCNCSVKANHCHCSNRICTFKQIEQMHYPYNCKPYKYILCPADKGLQQCDCIILCNHNGLSVSRQ
ncbi:unnamed protein product [Trichobilharzia szidati]|nr:unnamed protein product [Trichobilharzia szidati]